MLCNLARQNLGCYDSLLTLADKAFFCGFSKKTMPNYGPIRVLSLRLSAVPQTQLRTQLFFLSCQTML